MSSRRRKKRPREPTDQAPAAGARRSSEPAQPADTAAASAARRAPARRTDDARAALFSWVRPHASLESFAGGPWALPAVLAFGLALRLVHLIALEGSPFATSLVLDARYYDTWAQAIAGGAWIGRSAFWVDPLYAYVLGALYTVAGRDLLLSRLLNIIFGLATALLVFRLGERVWRSRAAALLAALLTITCIPTLYFEGQNEKTALTVLLVTAAAVLFLGGSLRAVAAAGVVTGMAALARGNALLFVPFGALALLCGWDRDPRDAASLTTSQRRWRAVVFVACALPVVGLATLHNWLASRELVLTTTNLGVNLYLGNHGTNLYGYYTAPDFLRPDTGAEQPDFRAEAQRRTGRPLSDRQLSDYWRGQAWQAVMAAPGLAMLRTAHKLQLALHNDEVPDNEDVRMVAEWSPVLRSPVFWLGELLALAVLGGVIGWRRRAVRVVVAMTVIYFVSLLPFFIMARLRVQVVPLLAVLGGGAIVWLIEAARQRDVRRWLAASAVVAPVLFIAFYRPEWMATRRSGSLAIAWNNLGSALADAGKDSDAIRAYERAVAINPAAVPASLRTLGELYRRRGDYPRAEAAMRQVLELKPQSRSAKEALRGLYAAMRSDPRWRDDPTIRARAQALEPPAAPDGGAREAVARARALAKQGRYDDAIRVLQDAVRRGPYDEGLHYLLGDMMERHATPDEMIQFFSEELPRDQKPQTSHYFQAVGLARRGDLDGAIAQLRRGLEIDPAHEMSQREWGVLLERQDKPVEALDHYLEAARIHPDYRAALDDAARVAGELGRTADAESYRQRAASADPNTIRRYVYWARYLHEHGRDEAALAEIQRMLQERPADAEALQLRDQIRGGAGRPSEPSAANGAAGAPAAARPASAVLSGEARAALVARLADQSAGETWIAYDTRDAAARRLAEDLAAAFREAHWSVRSLGPLAFPIKPGLFVLVGEQPSARTTAVHEALDKADLRHTVGTGYRAFSAERQRADPNWRGAEFAEGQEFVIIVGRQPQG